MIFVLEMSQRTRLPGLAGRKVILEELEFEPPQLEDARWARHAAVRNGTRKGCGPGQIHRYQVRGVPREAFAIPHALLNVCLPTFGHLDRA